MRHFTSKNLLNQIKCCPFIFLSFHSPLQHGLTACFSLKTFFSLFTFLWLCQIMLLCSLLHLLAAPKHFFLSPNLIRLPQYFCLFFTLFGMSLNEMITELLHQVNVAIGIFHQAGGFLYVTLNSLPLKLVGIQMTQLP